MKPENENGKSELAAAIARGATSAIPFLGGIISEVGNLYLNPLEKRKQEWMRQVSEAIENIENRFSRLPKSLETDEAFISMLYQITIVALKNHQREKLYILQNAIESSADPNRISEDLSFQFIRYVDELSVTHLKILADLERHAGQITRLKALERIYWRINELTGLSIDRAMFRSFIQDLHSRFLIRIGDIDDFPEFATQQDTILLEGSKTRPLKVTKLGRAFLEYIQQPNYTGP